MERSGAVFSPFPESENVPFSFMVSLDDETSAP